MRRLADAGPGLRQFARSATRFLGLVGLATLLIGGVGVSNAVAGFLERRAETIAVLKSLGATSGTIYRTYLLLVLALAAAGVLVGIVLGGGAGVAAAPILGRRLALELAPTLYARPLIEAAALGLLVAALFSLWPLAKSRAVSPTELFRGRIRHRRWRPRVGDLIALGLVAATLVGGTLLIAVDRWLTLGFLGGAVLAFALFRGLAFLLAAGARQLARRQRRRPALRLALANLARPGAPTPSVALSLGLALTVLVVVATRRRAACIARLRRRSRPRRRPSISSTSSRTRRRISPPR